MAENGNGNGKNGDSASNWLRITRDAPPSYWVVLCWLIVSGGALYFMWDLAKESNDIIRQCVTQNDVPK